MVRPTSWFRCIHIIESNDQPNQNGFRRKAAYAYGHLLFYQDFVTRVGDSARAKKAGWQKEMDKTTDQVQGHFEGGAAYSLQGLKRTESRCGSTTANPAILNIRRK